MLDPAVLSTLRVIGAVVLVALLVAREVAAHASTRWRWLANVLSIAVLPLLGLFALTVASITYEYLSTTLLR